jgi:hypothetical protein
LPAFDLSATGDRAMVDDDDAPTTILGAAPHPQPHGISTVHAPAKSVPPPPAPAANVVIAELDSAPHHSLEVPSSEPTLRPNDAARGSRLLIGITAAATTLIALSLTTLVVLELTRKDEPPAAPPAPTTTTRPAPPPARAAVEPVATDQPVDPATLPTEDSALREGSELPEAATSTAAPIRAPATRTRSVPQRAGRTGYLTVVCDPICDSVHAAGKSLGPSPILGAALPAGGHAVMLRRKGARSRTIRVTIVSGETTVQRVKMGS